MLKPTNAWNSALVAESVCAKQEGPEKTLSFGGRCRRVSSSNFVEGEGHEETQEMII